MKSRFTRLGLSCLFFTLAAFAVFSFRPPRFEAATKGPVPPRAPMLAGEPQFKIEQSPLESPKGMTFYKIQRLPVRAETVAKFQTALKLTVKPTPAENLSVLAEEKTGIARLQTDKVRGHMILLPNWNEVALGKPQLVTKENAFRLAQNFIEQNQLIVKDVSVTTPQHLVTLSRAELHQGGQAVVSDVGQTVLFQRTIAEKPVLGNGSQIVVDLGHQGSVVGFTRTWNQLSAAAIEPQFKSDQEVYAEVESQLKQRIQGQVNATAGKLHLIYYSADKEFVQPAYFFTVQIDAPGVNGKSFLTGLVAAAKNTPEPIAAKAPPSVLPTEKAAAANPIPPTNIAADDPTVGRYVVRQDSWDWVDDANEFAQGLNDGHPSGFPAFTFGDYYWDEPAFWTTSDNSFVNRWNVTLMEGHGNTWLFTTRSNCCDVVNLDSSSQPGYGNLPSSSMRFLILKGCSIIPAPPDRSNWPDPWWRIFKGLRQAVGFRTEMYIDDDISYGFAKNIAGNYRILDSWFAATNGSGSYQWERFWGSWGDQIYGYGTVVMIPGDEADGIYSTAAAPPASSVGLSIWWQH